MIQAQLDEQERVEKIKNKNQIYQMDCMVPGSKCRYVAYSEYDDASTVEDFRVTLLIDFPPDVDFDKE